MILDNIRDGIYYLAGDDHRGVTIEKMEEPNSYRIGYICKLFRFAVLFSIYLGDIFVTMILSNPGLIGRSGLSGLFLVGNWKDIYNNNNLIRSVRT